MEGVRFADGNLNLEPLVKWLAHRYPDIKLIEVEAGPVSAIPALPSTLIDQYTAHTSTNIFASDGRYSV